MKAEKDNVITSADVVRAFKEAGGRGGLPDASAVDAITEYIDENAWNDRAILKTRRGFRRKSPLMDPFWKSLAAIQRTGAQVLESQTHIRERYRKALGGQCPDLDMAEYDNRIEKIDRLLMLAKDLSISMFPSYYGKRHERWHDVALEVAPLILNAYRAAGRKTVDFQTTTSCAVFMVHWVLQKFGHGPDYEAIVQALKRAKFRTT